MNFEPSAHNLALQQTYSRVTVYRLAALEILKFNFANRVPTRDNIRRLMDDMRNGSFVFNGVPIVLAWHTDTNRPELIDGQQRLTACAQADCPFETTIITGLPPSTKATFDIGRSRTLADATVFQGLQGNPSTIAAVCLGLLRIETLGLEYAFSSGGHYPITRSRELDYMFKNKKEILAAAHFAESCRKKANPLMHPKLIGITYTLFHRADSVAADIFFNQLYDGSGLDAQDPIFLLRERLLAARSAQKRFKLTPREVWGITIKAWNSYRQGRKIVARTLQQRLGDSIPEIVGLDLVATRRIRRAAQ